MAEPEATRDPEEPYELPDGVKAIPPEAYQRPGGCGFTGCMYAVMIFAALALLLLVIGLLTRQWIVPTVNPRGG